MSDGVSGKKRDVRTKERGKGGERSGGIFNTHMEKSQKDAYD